ncbi:MAG: class II aldolase/adducin family protein [Verrucomicrobiota bacterium]
MNEKRQVAAFMRRLYQQKLTTTSGGNISCRTDDHKILLTPSGLDKSVLEPSHIGVLTETGENLTPELRPSIELQMHLAVYEARPDVQAIVHAHPVTATAFCASRRKINCRYIAESYVIVGDPVTVPYACMGTTELADNVGESAVHSSCLLLANHGVLAAGKTLLTAFNKIEVLEEAARINLVLDQLGDSIPLDEAQLAQLTQAE